VDDEHAVSVRHSNPDRLPARVASNSDPRERPGAQLVEIEVTVRELEQLRPELVLIAVGVLLYEPVVVKGAKKPVDRALGQAQPVRKLA